MRSITANWFALEARSMNSDYEVAVGTGAKRRQAMAPNVSSGMEVARN